MRICRCSEPNVTIDTPNPCRSCRGHVLLDESEIQSTPDALPAFDVTVADCLDAIVDSERATGRTFGSLLISWDDSGEPYTAKRCPLSFTTMHADSRINPFRYGMSLAETAKRIRIAR